MKIAAAAVWFMACCPDWAHFSDANMAYYRVDSLWDKCLPYKQFMLYSIESPNCKKPTMHVPTLQRRAHPAPRDESYVTAANTLLSVVGTHIPKSS